MALLRPRPAPSAAFLRRVQTTVPCPFNGFQVGWCRGLCEPIAGMGVCGRIAPHTLIGRTQAAVAAYAARRNPADQS